MHDLWSKASGRAFSIVGGLGRDGQDGDVHGQTPPRVMSQSGPNFHGVIRTYGRILLVNRVKKVLQPCILIVVRPLSELRHAAWQLGLGWFKVFGESWFLKGASNHAWPAIIACPPLTICGFGHTYLLNWHFCFDWCNSWHRDHYKTTE